MRRFSSSRPLRVLAVTTAAVLALAGCSAGAQPEATAEADITIEHALGTTVVPAGAERVVTWGWSSNDAAIALGVVPVAMPAQSYGGDDEGVLPWVREAIEANGAEMPTILTESEDPPYDEIAAAEPDVILATYSGLTADQYELLSEIAPTVAYPEVAWSTPWRDVVSIVGQALGRNDEAATVIADTEELLGDTAAAHPELAGVSFASVADFSGVFYVYEPVDPRVEFLTDLGLVVAPSVSELSPGDGSFFYQLSYEELDKLTSDILVAYFDDAAAAVAFPSQPYVEVLPQAKDEGIASVVGAQLVSAVSPPTPLSLAWGLDEYVALLSAAAENASR